MKAGWELLPPTKIDVTKCLPIIKRFVAVSLRSEGTCHLPAACEIAVNRKLPRSWANVLLMRQVVNGSGDWEQQ